MSHLHILVIDDEEAQLKSLRSFLQRRNYTVETATSGPAGLEIINQSTIDLVITDFRMPEWDGLQVIKEVRQSNPDIDVIVMTAYGNIEDAVRIMKAGAYDYLTKPIDLDELEQLINRIDERRTLRHENQILREQLQEKFRFDAIISQSGEMEDVLNRAARVAASKANVLIRGESGTGKELVARAIHIASPRRDHPFIVVNVAALAETTIESELFGHEQGAFTGATRMRRGRFEQAHGGTLFIDEVGEIPASVQVKLLRVLQFGTFERLGSSRSIEADVRIIAATHRDLEKLIQEGAFREDLYYRLNVVSIRIPALQRRKTDIPLLVNHFISKYAAANSKSVTGISREALDMLMKYEFPGNVRELENMIEHAVVMSRSDHLSIQDFPTPLRIVPEHTQFDPHRLDEGYEQKMKLFEREMIREALSRSDGNQSAAARLLGISERHLRSRLNILGLK